MNRDQSNLQKLLILGLDRQRGGEEPATPTHLLQALSRTLVQRKAGFVPNRYEGELPEQNGVEPDEGALRRGELLRHVCQRDPRIIQEFLLLCRRSGNTVPAAGLPAIFELAADREDIRDLLLEQLGERGRWLAAQHPQWRLLIGPDEQDAWNEGTRAERLGYLRSLRRRDPAAARELLRSEWSVLSTELKLRYLSTCNVHLSVADEAFLWEQVLQDRIIEVRSMGQKLAARIPEGHFVRQAFATLQPMIDKEGRVSCQDSELALALKPLGFRQNRNIDQSVWKLIALLPPRYWEKQFGEEARQAFFTLLHSAQRSRWLTALIQSAALHRDPVWMEQIVAYWLQEESEAWRNKEGKRLLQRLPGGPANALCEQYLDRYAATLENDHLLLYLLQREDFFWRDDLSIKIVQLVQDHVQYGRAFPWESKLYQRLLDAAAVSVNPKLLERFRCGWEAAPTVWAYWEQAVERFIKTLTLRKQIHLAFNK